MDRDPNDPRTEEAPIHRDPPLDRTKPGNRGTYAAILFGTAAAVVLVLVWFNVGDDGGPPPPDAVTVR